jgi:hypothetical protein
VQTNADFHHDVLMSLQRKSLKCIGNKKNQI